MAETTPQLTLAVDDRVVYPSQGVCRVSGIDTKEIAGQKLVFVTLEREEDGARVMVPQQKLSSIGLRKVASSDEVKEVFQYFKAETDKADLDWKQRARTNLERMSQGGVLGLAEVVKGLHVLSELRPLPGKERELYDNARHLLVTELSASLSIPECDAEDAIDLSLSPPGKERPKRTAEEFRRPGMEEEGLEFGEELELEPLGEPEEEAPAPVEEAPAPPKKVILSDEEVTMPMATALLDEEERPKKRGRPAKAKTVARPPAVPKPVRAPPPIKVELQKEHPKKRSRPTKKSAVAKTVARRRVSSHKPGKGKK